MTDELAQAVGNIPQPDWEEAAAVLVVVAILLAAYEYYKRWKKKEGYRMILKDLDAKEQELLSRIINDGLFEAECKGEISNTRVRHLYAKMSKKLDLPDLVPKKHRLKIVKEQIKKNRNSTDPSIVAAREHHPKIPGGPPTPIVRPKFGVAFGKFAARFAALTKQGA